MTTLATTETVIPLYSQTPWDDHGNFSYSGDLYQARESLPALCRRVARHLACQFRDSRFSISRQRRTLRIEVIDTPADLTDEDARAIFETRVSDQVQRFGFSHQNAYQDFTSFAFHVDVRVGPSYWAALAARRGHANPVQPLISLSAFKRQLKAGDSFQLIAASTGNRAPGTISTITAVRSGDLVFDGRTYWDFPLACCFACDGRLIRVARGNKYDPDNHVLYEWLRAP